jgi:hypothetical protein
MSARSGNSITMYTKVKVNWDFEYVDINMRSCDGKLLRHCDYKNDWRSNNDGCAVFSYSVHIRGKKYRVVCIKIWV